jgi:Condensation domain/Phosphopantetheine attachment site
MSPAQRAAVAAHLDKFRGKAGHAIRRRPDPSKPAAASFAQERLWFVDALDPGKGLYNITAAISFAGPLNSRALANSLAFIVERHETLRTTFSFENGTLVQIVNSPAPVALPVLDLSGLDEARRAEQIERITSRELEDGFDLVRGPVLRAILLRETERSHTLLLTTHHISSDGWSIGILQREIGAAYEEYSRGATPWLPPLMIQYSDYAEWQRERYRQGAWESLIAFWKEQLQGAPAVISLPTCRPRPEQRNYDGGWISIELPPKLVSALNRLALRERCTLFMIVLASYGVLLQRFSGQDSVVIGVPVANRGSLELEAMIGFFVNSVPMHLHISATDRFLDVLQRVRNVALQAFQHQEFPFEKLVEEIKPDRALNYNPVFQATFSLQNLPTIEAVEAVDPDQRADRVRGSIKFDVSLHLRPVGPRIVGLFGYATDLLDDETGNALASSLKKILTDIAARPELLVSDLVPAEAGHAITEPLPVAALAKPSLAAHRPFEIPSRGVAAVDSTGVTTWSEIAASAGTLRGHLAQQGLSRGVAAAVSAIGWTGWITGAAAVALAGGVTVPTSAQASAPAGANVQVIGGPASRGGEAEEQKPGPALRLANGTECSDTELRELLTTLTAQANLPSGTIAATGQLRPENSVLLVLLAAAAGWGLTAASPNAGDFSALLDHATWEGAGALFLEAEEAGQLADHTHLPLHALYVIVLDGPLSPRVAKRLNDRGARGLIITGGAETLPWLFMAEILAAADDIALGRPLVTLEQLEVRDARGEPVPAGAVGALWGRRRASDVPTILVDAPVRRGPNGRLQVRVADRPPARTVRHEASAPIAQALLGICEDVLEHSIALDEDFFSAGGHSLHVAQLVTRVRELLRKSITIQKVFESRTVRKLSADLAADSDAEKTDRAARLLIEVSSLTEADVEARLAAMNGTG